MDRRHLKQNYNKSLAMSLLEILCSSHSLCSSCVLACSLPSAGDCSNVILGVLRLNHKKQGIFKDNVIKKKKNTFGEDEK